MQISKFVRRKCFYFPWKILDCLLLTRNHKKSSCDKTKFDQSSQSEMKVDPGKFHQSYYICYYMYFNSYFLLLFTYILLYFKQWRRASGILQWKTQIFLLFFSQSLFIQWGFKITFCILRVRRKSMNDRFLFWLLSGILSCKL